VAPPRPAQAPPRRASPLSPSEAGASSPPLAPGGGGVWGGGGGGGGGATIEVSVAIPDSVSQTARLRLYEPDGAPCRALGPDSVVRVGGMQPGTARLVVGAEDLAPGVYELDVVAPPVSGVTATVRAE